MGLFAGAAGLDHGGLAVPGERFDRLEGAGALPEPVKQALSGLGRFDHLEIGAAPHAAAAAAPAAARRLCLRCGRPNEKDRESCWACFAPLKAAASAKAAAAAPAEITIVLDGVTYRSGDPDLPSDVKVLIDRIRRNGYSPELLAQWRTWRATRNEPARPQRPFESAETLIPAENQGKDPLTGNQAFKGQRTSVIRLDGKFYTSDDRTLSPEIKQLFGYIDAHGVTPELMLHLRELGKKAVVRPATTTAPTVEDLAFWKDAAAARAPQPAAAAENTGHRGAAIAVAAGAVALYVLLRLAASRP